MVAPPLNRAKTVKVRGDSIHYVEQLILSVLTCGAKHIVGAGAFLPNYDVSVLKVFNSVFRNVQIHPVSRSRVYPVESLKRLLLDPKESIEIKSLIKQESKTTATASNSDLLVDWAQIIPNSVCVCLLFTTSALPSLCLLSLHYICPSFSEYVFRQYICPSVHLPTLSISPQYVCFLLSTSALPSVCLLSPQYVCPSFSTSAFRSLRLLFLQYVYT